MLPLSGAAIRLNRPSRDYILGIILLHVLAAIIVVRSALPSGVTCVFIVLLLVEAGIHFLYYAYPHPHYASITYHGSFWQLHDRQGHMTTYDSALLENMGFFLLLTLQQKHRNKILVIFTDQVTPEEHRVLHWITYAPKTKH